MESESVTFQEAARLIRQGVNPEDVGNMPYVGLEHIEEGSLRLIGIGNAKNVTSTKFRFSKGDILFGKLRPYFRKVIRPGFDGVCSTDIWVVRSKEGIDQGYLYYWMASNDFVNFATQGSEGTKMPRAKWDHVGRFQRQRLGVAEQRAIAHILGSLDDRIELNRRINQTLEAMARAIFKSWFVDFDPVRAKAEGRPTGLPDDIAALFPDSFEESELGEIPKRWSRTNLKDGIEIHDSKRIPLNKRQRAEKQGAFPYYGAAGIMDYVDDYLFDGVYILTGEDGSVADDLGYPVVQYVWGKFWVNNHAHVLKGKNRVCDEHLYLFLQQTDISAFVTGAVQPKLSQANLKAIPFILPDKTICSVFSELIQPSFQKIRENTDENRTLAALRDTLLPKLISGELRVPDAEAIIEGAD
jgi:type I restriction enzyme, S subunit